MSTTRCPSCGGLVTPDAEWCGQCFARLREPARPLEPEPEPAAAGTTPPAPAAQGGPDEAEATTQHAARDIRTNGGPPAEEPPRASSGPSTETSVPGVRKAAEGLVWTCPSCGTENALDATTCSVCGTPFGRLLQDPAEERRRGVDPGRAATLSLFFPGAGHYAVGRVGEGIARGIIFAFALATGLLALSAVLGNGGTVFIIVMVLGLGAAGALYVVSTLDAGRAAQDIPPVLSTRMLLYGAVGLMLATLVLLTLATVGGSPSP